MRKPIYTLLLPLVLLVACGSDQTVNKPVAPASESRLPELKSTTASTVPEPWSSVIAAVKSTEKVTNLAGDESYRRTLSDLREAERKGNPEEIYFFVSAISLGNALSNTDAYYTVIPTLQNLIKSNPDFIKAHWGLGFAYYNLTLAYMYARHDAKQQPTGLFTFPLDDETAKLLYTAFSEALISFRMGYFSEPNLLEMAAAKLIPYCHDNYGTPSGKTICEPLGNDITYLLSRTDNPLSRILH
jgi:hypothetical protein